MDIYILRDGQETGPHRAEEARTLLDRGEVSGRDFAWSEGLPDWTPLEDLLAPVAADAPDDSPAAKVEPSEPATPKQEALLSFLGIALRPELSRDDAAKQIDAAQDDPVNASRLILWGEERFRLYPELFAAEIQAKKENRATHFFTLCESAGAKYFNGIGKAHCQVLVGFLDVKFPNWDARESEAAEHFFFPAVAEKFPQLVKKQWRGRLHYGHGPKVAPEIAHSSPATGARTIGTTPLVAISRGVFLGLVILGGLYLAHRSMEATTNAAPPAETSADEPPARPINPPRQMPAPVVEDAAAKAPAIESLPPSNPSTPAPAPTPELTVVPPAPEPTMSEAPSAPPPMESPALPGPMFTAPTIPMTDAPMSIPPAPEFPAPEPPALTAPAPPVAPAPSAIPSATNSALRTDLLLTKPVDVVLTYGRILLPPGTPVKLISRQGAMLRVSCQNSVILIPANSTDLE